MQFQFNTHRNLNGMHAIFSPSQPSWLRYDDDKALEVFTNRKAAEMGSRIHAWAAETINLKIRQPRSKKTIYAYVNDAIGFDMDTEVVLFYSERFFGTADTICFDGHILRIHDLKTGKHQATIEQLKVYAALFCLEYLVKPKDISIELRIYQNDEIDGCVPEAEEIQAIMNHIVHLDKLLAKYEEA